MPACYRRSIAGGYKFHEQFHEFNKDICISWGQPPAICIPFYSRSREKNRYLSCFSIQPRRIGRAIEHAYNGAQRAATLTNRLLAFARKQPFDPKVVNPNQLISGISDFFRRTVGETIELEIFGAQGLWNTETDPNQLEAALLNLVVNARDAMPKRRQADD